MSSSIHNHDRSGRNRIFNRVNGIVEGWYWLIPSNRLKRGKTVAVTLMGRDLVAYRTREGNPVVMDAYCPHMGCHLSLGQVEDNCLRCFFHNWAFGEDGRCVDIPSLDQPLPNVKVTT